jgi:hypothetical protein
MKKRNTVLRTWRYAFVTAMGIKDPTGFGGTNLSGLLFTDY